MTTASYSISALSSASDRARMLATPPQRELESLLLRQRGAVFAFIRRKGFSAEDADDLTQETLVRAYQHLGAFRGTAVTAWLYRIASNVSVDHLRRRRVPTMPLDDALESIAGEDDPCRDLHRRADTAWVRELISTLPECHRKVLALRFFEDRSLTEIASALGCSPLAAKLRVFRAVAALRRKIASGWMET